MARNRRFHSHVAKQRLDARDKLSDIREAERVLVLFNEPAVAAMAANLLEEHARLADWYNNGIKPVFEE